MDAKKCDLLFDSQKWSHFRPKREILQQKRQRLNAELEKSLRTEAQALWTKDKQVYDTLRLKNQKNSDFLWLKTVITKGTFSDKLSAHTKLIQDCVVHNLDSLKTMIEMVTVKAKRGCVVAMDMLKELFLGDILLRDSKLKNFSELIPYLENKPKKLREQQLVAFLFEENVAKLYRQFVEAVEKVSHDSVDACRDKAVNVMFELLSESPEQEHFLLEKLVNKLGDPTAKRASHVSFLLVKLVNEKHPAMKYVVVAEVERVLYRPNITMKAQYYGLCFLNEIILNDNDQKLADKLINLYFNFFKVCLKKGEVHNKMMNALLTGVNRSFPYSKLDSQTFDEHVDTFFKVIHFVNFNVAIQVMNLLLNVMDSKRSGLLSDRFYCVLYRCLLENRLEECSKKAVFLNLVYRAMKKDSDCKRIKAFIKRLQQVALQTSSAIAAGILILISQIQKLKPELNFGTLTVDEESDEEEKYDDVRDSGDSEEEKKVDIPIPSWVHSRKEKSCLKYNIQHRNPLYANVDNELLWETVKLSKHYHPSVSLFSNSLLHNCSVEYDGDPLTDFTIKNFLDRFVFRNPKKIHKDENSKAHSSCVFRRATEKVSPAIDSHNFVKIPEERIPIEERFIYKYFRGKSHEKEEDNASVTSEEFERMLEKYEPGFEKDLVDDLRSSKKNIDVDEDDDDLSELDDEEYNKHFEDVDGELQDVFEEEDIPVKYEKRGHDKDLSSLFASADKFAEMLEANDEDEESDSEDEELNDKRMKGAKRNRTFKRPKQQKRRK